MTLILPDGTRAANHPDYVLAWRAFGATVAAAFGPNCICTAFDPGVTIYIPGVGPMDLGGRAAHAIADLRIALENERAKVAALTDPQTGAAATEKASVLRYIARVRSRIPGTPGILADVQRLFGVFIDEMERAIESNAHHEAPK